MADAEEFEVHCICSAADRLATYARDLFREYGEEIQVDLSFQNFDEELIQLPGKYAPPSGRLFVALFNGRPAGCVAIRRLESDTCEMKRLYVRPYYRGTGIGRRLAQAAIDAARAIGYRAIYLDTLPTMTTAAGLYGSLGFREIPPYYDSPIQGTRFMKLDLESEAGVCCVTLR